MDTGSADQDGLSVEKNKTFFADNTSYANNIRELTTYRNIRDTIDRQIGGSQKLLDVGNGGVFDYDTSLVREIVGVDLFLDDISPDVPANVTLRRGDALALDEGDGSYDTVLLALVLHHLVSTDVEGTVANIRRAIEEAARVLTPEGRLVIVESCVSPFAFAIERRLFGMLRLIVSSGMMAHPPTLQLPPNVIADFLRLRFTNVAVERVRVGALLMQFGRRWPTLLTPARPYLFTADNR